MRQISEMASCGRAHALGGLALAMAITGASPAVGDEPARVTAAISAVQVTDNPAPVRAHSSPQIARNPINGQLVVVESDVRGSRACTIHISTDDGRSWFAGGDPMVKPFTDCGFYAEYGAYATMAFAKNGDLYVAFVASEFLNRERNATPRHVFLARSSDGGRSFATTKVFDAPDGNIDRGLNKGPMIAVDPTHPERVYVGWRQGVFASNATEKLKANVAPSADGGRTFGAPVEITDERGGDYPALAVTGDGTVHAVYWTRTFPPGPSNTPGPPRPIQYSQSTDHGKTWSKPVPIDPGNQSTARPPVLAADPTSNVLYMAWYGNTEVNNQAPGYVGYNDIFLRSSVDGGKSWGERVTVNDDHTNANQFEPGISVAPNGRLDIAWYDFRNSLTPPVPTTGQGNETGLADVYYSSSSDQGRTLTPNVRITDRSIDRSVGVWPMDSKFNVGISSTNAGVYFAWQDTRNAIRNTDAEDVYATTLVLKAQTKRSGSRSVPAWLLVGAGLAVGMGITMLLVSRFKPARPG